MPHIRVRGLPLEDLESVSDLLVETLAELTDTPNSHFTLEYQASTFFAVGGASPAYPFIEILWFDRGAAIKAKVAQAVDDLFRPLIEPGQDITTLFTDINKADYFENGAHF
ncbi:DUF1904 domain-containing protein [Marinomonas piezotolerans]|uniref:DUF1904 domain-containing protein n=1 Tax=Marinomonas piezotolerans TaxID=2213058 RepID=A0A370U8J4_9GAMM|nr:DUF1904 family protein [Marinomonas piezotolerans]RDL44116.1 DUF1904 domain-containing protein [Marinomonas piezotolerans]